MYPIFEEGKGEGLGHSERDFYKRFIAICQEHLDNGRAKSFAIILYDIHHTAIQEIYRTPGSFAQLHLKSGNDITIFFLDSQNRRLLKKFNTAFLHAFDIKNKHSLPFILFFKIVEGDVSDIAVVELQQSKSMFAFKEIVDVVQLYLDKNSASNETSKDNLKWLKGIKKVTNITLEKLIESVVSEGLNKLDKLF
ncbi:hypothetical protein [Daejeonella lutea]|uniref:Uncharacterized protein n=1 Tax=Daejeonella lutea TaxID=572036 RepID=A0A1T5CWX7_9SPHI|nr:hypothetical protein [Daejeonella lutea]SKB64028.1 hypothetical protein SAMN05661099_1984 [Daejeonella lutea]